MEIGQINCDNLGMTRDTTISALSTDRQTGTSNYAFENHNIRIMAVNDNTKFAVTNEKGTLSQGSCEGTFMGACKVGRYVVVFTKDVRNNKPDYIYRISYINYNRGGSLGSGMQIALIYKGNLNFSLDHPIEAIGYYESEEIQKVYWVDGFNQNRFINVTADAATRANWNDLSFDFQGSVYTIPKVEIAKDYNKAGSFQAGTIQYFITYFNKYGVETCIVWNSDLQYISMQDRGAKPDEAVSCAFKITLEDLDTSYDYVRIYANYRSNIDGVSTSRIVTDLSITGDTASYIDYGVSSELFPAQDLPYVGGQKIIAGTLDYKQDTMFYGDIKIASEGSLNVAFKKTATTIADLGCEIQDADAITWKYKKVSDLSPRGSYSYKSEMEESQAEIAGFKWREVYRFGIQFMTKTGEWTSAYWIGDKYCDLQPYNDDNGYYIATPVVTFPNLCNYSDCLYLSTAYLGYRLLVADSDITSRRIVAQGVICPTMFNYTDRYNNKPYSIPSYIFRPRLSTITHKHYQGLPLQTADNAEMQGITEVKLPGAAIPTEEGDYNAYMLVLAANQGHRIKWKLIYYNCGNDDATKIANLNKVYDKDNTETGIFGTNYKVVSSGTVNTTKWANSRSAFFGRLSADVTASGERNVFSSAMLPDADLFHDFANLAEANTQILAIIGMAIATAAAVVATVFSAGAAAAITAPALAAGMSALTSACSSAAIAGMSATAAMAATMDDLSAVDRRMAARGFWSMINKHDVTNRERAAKNISEFLTKYFEGGTRNGYFTLNGDTEEPFNRSQSDLGSDYNAYVVAGALTFATPNEEDLNSKQDLFCVDESIVTLNSPDTESLQHIADNSSAFRLDLVGTIPVEAAHGEYILQTTLGLNNSAEVLRNRFIDNPIVTSDVQGLLNADIYQDCLLNENDIQSATSGETEICEPMVVTANTGLYRQFMWGRETSAGFWFPGIPLIKATATPPDEGEHWASEDYVTEPAAQIVKKIFANLRYSTGTNYYTPYTMDIENPSVCLDDQVMLKKFKFDGEDKYYYENVDTIAAKKNAYPLVVNGGNIFPEESDNINRAGLKDPIHLLFKETPHALIPFKVSENGAHTILPYTQSEAYETIDALYNNYEDAEYEGLDVKAEYYRQYPGSDDNLILNAKYLKISTETIGGLSLPPSFYIVVKTEEGVTSKRVYRIASGTAILLTNNTTKYVKRNFEGYVTCNIQSETFDTFIRDKCTDTRLLGWKQSPVLWETSNSPYLFLGELVKKNFDYSSWHGGTDHNALEKVVWNVASNPTRITDNIETTWGDTFYQRWDCQKTYPFTEQDKNSVVDVLSFMVESHRNIDGRCDINRGLTNLINLRPTNTMMNEAYSQEDDFFSYNTLDEKFSKDHFESDVLWSLTKNNMDNIDKWTSLVATNEMSLDGRFGPVRKILNVNDTLLAFQDKGIAGIKYNETTAINTTSGLPLQLSNTGKVDGYRMLTDTTGCYNKWSINKNSSGVFYMDDFNKSFNMFSVNGGAVDVGIKAEFSKWFKDHLKEDIWTPNNSMGFKTYFDEITHDLYIFQKDKCLVFNALLGRFTSFMDYVDTPYLFNLEGDRGISGSFTLKNSVDRTGRDMTEVWQLFRGQYNLIYDKYVDYSMEYRLHPVPLHDSIFTNYEYTADWIVASKMVSDTNQFITEHQRYTTFDTVEAKNEYQYGISKIETSRMGIHNIKAKFRVWRGNIPRDGETLTYKQLKGDRMRNPWLHIKFTKNGSSHDLSKMVFHNLMITYYNQYGRY